MSLARFSVHRPVTILMGILAFFSLGIMSWIGLKIDLFPDITFPVVAVITVYPGAGPEEVEEYVTRPIEEQCGLVKNLKHISSTSNEGLSMVILEFNWGTNMDAASFDTREKVDQVIQQLPDDAERPFLVKLDPQTVFPIMTLTVTGLNDMQELRKFTEDVIQPDLEKVDGVAAVDVFGGLQREIQVLLDRDRLAAYNLSVGDIQQAIEAENLNLPGGNIKLGSREFTVRTVGEFKHVEDIEAITVAIRGGVPVRLRDVATVRDSHKEIRQYARFKNQPTVALVVRKESEANVVNTAHAMRKAVAEINERLSGNLRITETQASADYIERALKNMYGVAEEGAILAIIIIFLFLTSGRSTLVIATSIPLSLLATMTFMRFTGMTLNMITLGGLTLAIGRIVDDSIVVLENIYRHIEEGERPFRAAIRGTGEVGLAIMAATFTTVCVFLPLGFIGGLVGQIFTPMAETVAVALLSSLVVSLTVVPMASSRLLRSNSAGGSSFWLFRWVEQVLARWESGYRKAEAAYGRAIRWCLGHRLLVLGLAAGIFLFSLSLIPLVGAEFFPHMDRGEIGMALEMPVGTNVETTNRIADEVERFLLSFPEIDVLTATVGESEGLGLGSVREASFQAKLKPQRERKRSTDDIIAEVRKKFGHRQGVKISFESGIGGGRAPIVITIYGDDLLELARIGEEALPKLREVTGLVDVRLNWERGAPEYQITIDRQKAGTYGLSTIQVASAVRTLVRGEETTEFRQEGKEYDIMVRLPEEARRDINQLRDLMIPAPNGALVPLTQVAKIEETVGPSLVSRYERRRSIEVQADKIPERPLDAIIADCDNVLRDLDMPSGYSYEFRGEEEDRRESFSGLFLALGMGILLIYIILASQFESIFQPFIIMLAIPLEVIGAFGALLLTGTSLSIMVMLGLLLLTGIVVSNSILLVNVVNQLRDQEGMPTREALIRGGQLRLRPILMTALATIAAMIPMALALREGSDIWRPLGITVLGGLVSSTFLTLLVVPVAYSVLDQIGTRLGIPVHSLVAPEEDDDETSGPGDQAGSQA